MTQVAPWRACSKALRCLLVLALFAGSPVFAQTCPVIEGGTPQLGEVAPTERIEFIHHSLLDGERPAKRWWVGWLTFLTAAEVVQLTGSIVGSTVPVPSTSSSRLGHFVLNTIHDDVPGLSAGTVTAAAGILSLVLTQRHPAFDGTAFALRLQTSPAEDPCVALAEGERLLLRSALAQRNGQAPISHILNAVANLASGLVVGIFFHQWVSAVSGFLVGTGVGELLILTEPTTAVKALDQYRTGALNPVAPRVAFKWYGLAGELRF